MICLGVNIQTKIRYASIHGAVVEILTLTGSVIFQPILKKLRIIRSFFSFFIRIYLLNPTIANTKSPHVITEATKNGSE